MFQERYSRQLIERTKSVWRPYATAPLSDQDAIEILDGMLGLTDTLSRVQGSHEQT